MFGILVSVFLILHNILQTGWANNYAPSGFPNEIDGHNVVKSGWRKEIKTSVFQALRPQKIENNSKQTAKSIKEYFAACF